MKTYKDDCEWEEYGKTPGNWVVYRTKLEDGSYFFKALPPEKESCCKDET
mgnify:CR=1 FL=1